MEMVLCRVKIRSNDKDYRCGFNPGLIFKGCAL